MLLAGMRFRHGCLHSRPMQIGIIGLGYVGLPLAVAFAEAEDDVVGLDVDAGKVAAINPGRATSRTYPASRWHR